MIGQGRVPVIVPPLVHLVMQLAVGRGQLEPQPLVNCVLGPGPYGVEVSERSFDLLRIVNASAAEENSERSTSR
jgi:hypothetical protein